MTLIFLHVDVHICQADVISINKELHAPQLGNDNENFVEEEKRNKEHSGHRVTRKPITKLTLSFLYLARHRHL